MVAIDTVCQLMRSYLLQHLRAVLDTRMTLGFLDHMMSLPFSFFQRRSALGSNPKHLASMHATRRLGTDEASSLVH